jgi:hypothetical protein
MLCNTAFLTQNVQKSHVTHNTLEMRNTLFPLQLYFTFLLFYFNYLIIFVLLHWIFQKSITAPNHNIHQPLFLNSSLLTLQPRKWRAFFRNVNTFLPDFTVSRPKITVYVNFCNVTHIRMENSKSVHETWLETLLLCDGIVQGFT